MSKKLEKGLRIFHRRLKVAASWAVLNYTTVYLQPVLELASALIQLLLERSTWIAGLLIVGLTGTDVVFEYVKSKGSSGSV